MSKKDKSKDFLTELVDMVGEQFGPGALARLGDPGAYEEITAVVSTGLPLVDEAIGVGGFPAKKLTEISGPESVGKTTFTKFCAAKAQAQGFVPVILDVEESGALEYDKQIGLDEKKAAAGQPTTCEEVLGIMGLALDLAAKRKGRVFCLWDSLAATPMSGELDSTYDEMMKHAPAERARYLGKGLPKIVHSLAESESVVIIVNQLRDKIGAAPFEKPTYSPGGRALRHWAHVRIEMSSRGKIVEKAQQVGIKSMIKVVKNKVAKPGREALIEIRFEPFTITDAVPKKTEPGRVERTPV